MGVILTGKNGTKVISVKLDYAILEVVNELIRRGVFKNYSDFIRSAIKYKISRELGEALLDGSPPQGKKAAS